MLRSKSQRVENQKIQHALRQVESFHGLSPDASTTEYGPTVVEAQGKSQTYLTAVKKLPYSRPPSIVTNGSQLIMLSGSLSMYFSAEPLANPLRAPTTTRKMDS